jgi:hypothetical protein
MGAACFVCFDLSLIPIAYHQDQNRRSWSAAFLVVVFLLQQQASVAYAVLEGQRVKRSPPQALIWPAASCMRIGDGVMRWSMT